MSPGFPRFDCYRSTVAAWMGWSKKIFLIVPRNGFLSNLAGILLGFEQKGWLPLFLSTDKNLLDCL
jgi:hypothetical protein